jgi:uncharacterized protein (DUF1015 family)
MADVRPFRGLRPRDDLAGEVIAPPYDVLSAAQARAIAQNRMSFVRVTRSEVDLDTGADPHGESAYAMARQNLEAFARDGVLEQDAEPTYYFYGQKMGEHSQVGVLAGASVEEYNSGLIAKHEFTRPDKEDDRTRHLDVLDAQVGLVFLAYRPTKALDRLTAEITARPPAWCVTTEDGVVHTLWCCPPARVPDVAAAFRDVPRLYIADGHHRSAAAARVHESRMSEGTAYFLAGLYPSDKLQVMAYNRIVGDLNGHTEASFLEQVRVCFSVTAASGPVPTTRGHIHMYLGDMWYELVLMSGLAASDPVGRLDVAALQNHLLAPILGIEDPRRSERIKFVGGIHGASPLSQAVQEGAAVAFSLFPTSLDELFAVADSGAVMPPKSTWFEPKLREGVVVRPL